MVLCRSHKVRLFRRLSVSVSQVKERKVGLVPLQALVCGPGHTADGQRAEPQWPGGWEQPRLTEGRALPMVASCSLVAGLGSWACPGGTGGASRGHPLPSTPGVAHPHGWGPMLRGEEELEVKAGWEERSSGIYQGRPLCG